MGREHKHSRLKPSKLKQSLVALIFGLVGLGGFAAQSTLAQLPQDVRDVFERMIDDLDDELAGKFKEAIKKDSATVEFTPRQFRRFRDSPINPFDGLDGIDAVDDGGNIALKFELPSLRGRTIHPLERQHVGIRKGLKSTIGSVAASTVGIFNENEQIALGIIVGDEGLIVSKASEVESETTIVCQLPDGRRLPAKVMRSDKQHDVVLLSVDLEDGARLTPVRWSDSQPRLGAFVVTPGFDKQVAAIGTYSSTVRSTVLGEQAFLGVQPQTTKQGVQIADVRPGYASYESGLRNGDIIFMMGEAPIRDVTDLVRMIRAHRPGDQVEIQFLREGRQSKLFAELAGRNMSGERAARFKMMNRLGTIPSRRSDGFPAVFQHDSPLFPEQCGGPIVDLEGHVLGMNIARNGRAASYAIPASTLKLVVEKLSTDSLALRPTRSQKN